MRVRAYPTSYSLGWDVAGEVIAVGDGVRRFTAGGSVIGLRDVLSDGSTHAEEAAHADGGTLTLLSALAARGQLTPRVDRTLPLEEIARGHTLVAAGGLRGRIVLVPEVCLVDVIRPAGRR